MASTAPSPSGSAPCSPATSHVTGPWGRPGVLWEVGPEGREVRALRAALDLDSGYLSRLLRTLERSGLAVTEPSGDGRVRTVRLTPLGTAERALLDERSDALAPVPARAAERRAARRGCVGGDGEVEQLLTAAPGRRSHPGPGDRRTRGCARGLLRRARPSGSTTGFDPGGEHPRRRGAGPAARAAAPGGAARRAGRLRGAEAARRRPAEIKRMWVAPDARGLGLGRRLLERAGGPGRGARRTAMRLETNRLARRGDRAVPLVRVPSRCRRSTTSPTPTTGSRSA